jgi:uncharacterized protein (DUF111 family)
MVLEQIAGTSGDMLLGIALTLIEVAAEYIAEAIIFLLERIFA